MTLHDILFSFVLVFVTLFEHQLDPWVTAGCELRETLDGILNDPWALLLV